MARKQRNNILESRTARLKLAVRRRPYPGAKLARGKQMQYRRNKGNGTWLLKVSDGHGKPWTKAFAQADDFDESDNKTILTFFEAQDVAKGLTRGKDGSADGAPITVCGALTDYRADLEARRANPYNAEWPRVHLTSALLSKPVALLAPAELKKWRDGLLGTMAPSTINRLCGCLCAALEQAAQHDKRIQNRGEWEIGLASLPNAQQVRNVILSDDKVRAFVAAVMRVGKSLAGPHRLTTTREFYVRRGERSAKMSVREITARTLDLARTGDRVEAVFAERQEVAARLYKTLLADSAEKIAAAIMPLIVRVTAIPTMPQDIPDLTRRAELWWTGKGFSAVVDGTTYPCDYPARNFDQQPKVRLRSLVCVDDRSEGTSRLIRADGLVEFSLIHPRREPVRGSVSRIYVGWVISLVAGVVAQVERLRYRLAWDAVEYGLEIQVCSTPPPALFWNDDGFRDGYTMKAELPLTLPRYSLNSGDDFNGLITTIVRDLINSCGVNSETVCKVPWTELIKA